MEMLSRRIHRIGYFRPVIPDVEYDNDIQMIRKRYHLPYAYESMFALTHTRAHHLSLSGFGDDLFKRILDRYKELEDQCDFVLCEGTDFTGLSSAFEFDFNAEAANHLGCPVLAVINGRRKTPSEVIEKVRAAQESFVHKGCTLLATVVNRAVPSDLQTIAHQLDSCGVVQKPIYVLPEESGLQNPTMGDITNALTGQVIQGGPEELGREVSNFRVVAMNLPRFLDYLSDGTLVITPGDRSDVILGTLSTSLSETYPNVAGILLTGGIDVDPQVLRLIHGMTQKLTVPVISVGSDTYTTAMDVSTVRGSFSIDNHRKTALALGLFETRVDLSELEARIDVVRSTRRTPIMFEYELIERAKAQRKHIVLPEGDEERVLRASEILLRRGVVDLTLLGNPDKIKAKIAALGLRLPGVQIIDPHQSEHIRAFAGIYYDMRKNRGMTEERARDSLTDVSFFGTMLVHTGAVDGMVSGAVHTTSDTIRPAFEIIRTRPGVLLVSSVFLMCLSDRVLVYGDCAVNPNPNTEQLADIAVSSAGTAKMFGVEPRIAMCSYSTGASAKGQDVDKVREATRIVRERRPDLKIEGPIQYDAAVDAGVANTKMLDSEVAGKATVFIFPDLNTGNNLYKAVQRSANAVAVGPVLQGLSKPVNDLSRGCTVTDIVNTVAITAVQAQENDAGKEARV
jgi:phosphate acetyltransferase